jgi:hypothetical protein
MISGGWYWWRKAGIWIVGPLPNGYVLVMDEDGESFELTPEQVENEVTEVPGPTRRDYWYDKLHYSWPDRLRRLPRRILFGKPPPVPPPIPPRREP